MCREYFTPKQQNIYSYVPCIKFTHMIYQKESFKKKIEIIQLCFSESRINLEINNNNENKIRKTSTA